MEDFPLDDVIAVGAGVPGVVDVEKSKIIILPNVGIGNIELGKIFKEKYGLKLFLRNDAQVACLAEAVLGKGKDFDRVFFVTISTGLGGSLCVNGVVQDYVTEVGHTLFKYKDGYQEFEVAGGTNIHKLAEINGLKIKSAKEMFELAEQGNKDGIRLLNEWKYIIKSYFKLMNDSYLPDIFVVTGGLMKSKALFFDEIKESLPDVLVEECYFNEQAGLVGSAVYAFQQAK
jgi:glucokinase